MKKHGAGGQALAHALVLGLGRRLALGAAAARCSRGVLAEVQRDAAGAAARARPAPTHTTSPLAHSWSSQVGE